MESDALRKLQTAAGERGGRVTTAGRVVSESRCGNRNVTQSAEWPRHYVGPTSKITFGPASLDDIPAVTAKCILSAERS